MMRTFTAGQARSVMSASVSAMRPASVSTRTGGVRYPNIRQLPVSISTRGSIRDVEHQTLGRLCAPRSWVSQAVSIGSTSWVRPRLENSRLPHQLYATSTTKDDWMPEESSDDKSIDWEAFAASAAESTSFVEVGGHQCGGWKAHQDAEPGWIASLEIDDAVNFRPEGATMEHPPRVLVLYGSLRERSFSRLMAFEAARLLDRCGYDVRVYCARGLPLRDPAVEVHPKVQELRYLSMWSEGQVWSSPEMHGNITGHFKAQIDWLPLNTGSVRPTQGRTCVVMQVNGGSQSFNAVNTLRILARWMRMPCCTNQSSVAKAWQEFDEDGRMKESDFRHRLVDVMEEFAKFTRIMREHNDFLNDRYSERRERAEQGRLLSQAEKEASRKA